MKTLIIRLGLGLSLLIGASQVLAEPLLNGLAVSVELNKERFIAALYSDTLSTNANELLQNNGERRMELKVTAKRFSARSLNNMWIEGMAINNPSAALRAESENLSKMVNMVRKSLVEGDVLSFDAVPGAGTRVELNGVQLGNIESEDFFTLLLRTWIGSVPLSSEFKADLLAGGKYNQDLRDRYAVLEPAPTRIAAIEGWLAPAPPAEATASVAAAPAITPPRPRVKIEAPRQTIQVPASETIEALRRQNPDQVASSLPQNRPTESSPDATKGATGENPSQTSSDAKPVGPAKTPPAATPTPTPTQVAQAEPSTPGSSTTNTTAKPPTTSRPATPPVDDEEEEEAVISATSLLDRQLYISNVMRHAQKFVKYPDRALRREQEGTVRVAVTLNKTGQLLGTLTVEESRYSILNQEAEDSIERAGPFEQFPDSMQDETFSFTIPVTFTISR